MTPPGRTVTLPTMHPGQVAAWNVIKSNRFTVGRCGRRWGKTDLGRIIVCDAAVKGKNLGWFAPSYKVQTEAYEEIVSTVEVVKRRSSKMEGVIRLITGGRIDFWTLENEDAGRSRKYHGIIVDEAAFTKPNMADVWQKAIRPTLLDYGGWAVALSNANGISPDNFLYQLCHDDPDPTTGRRKFGFAEFHAPTHQNPYLPQEELDKLVLENHPMVYRQEYLAEFVDWSGVAFFARESLLVNDLPVAYPARCDAVFATVDTAVKTNLEHDSTFATFWAISKGFNPYPLVVLDWDITQIEGDVLHHWLKGVLDRCEELAKVCGARRGSIGALIEDKQTGTVLIQHGKRNGWKVHAIDSKLTSLGKDERAIVASGPVYQGKVKVSDFAYHKTKPHKGAVRNHLLSQVFGFRVGQKNQPDDGLDTFTYGVSVGLGGPEGF